MANNMYKRLSFTSMKANRFYLSILISCLLLWPIALHAQEDNRPTSYVGIQVGGGFSNLFVSNPMLSPMSNTQTLLGGGASASLFYNLEYRHFLLHTGFGVSYTYNLNRFGVEDITASIAEYPTMKYHYTFDNMVAHTTYGVGYIPLMIGANYEKWYFLAGAKFGLLPFASFTRSIADVNVWAMDEEIIDPLEGLHTHHMQNYYFKGSKTDLDFAMFNPMLSAEVGITLNKRVWMDEKERRKYDRAQRYRNARQKKSFKQLTSYRLALFADYGLSNIRPAYQANAAQMGGQNHGGIASLYSLSDMTVHSAFGYEPYRESKVNNLFVGLKLSMQIELPKKAPKKGALATPYVYVYVKDDVTNKPIKNARVQIQSETGKSRTDKLTDEKHGRVARGFVPGPYWIHVSNSKYLPHDTIHFEHRDDYDTIRVALHPKYKFGWYVVDDFTDKPIHAEFELLTSDSAYMLQSKTDSTHRIAGVLDDRLSYKLSVSAEGYHPYTVDMEKVFGNDFVVRLKPIPVKTLVLKNIYFATAKTNILPSSEAALEGLYNLLVENPDLMIRVVGHTDDVGTEASNYVLSQGRANSVKEAMVKRGISANRIVIAGKGESEPVLPNTSDENRQKNRRVEIEYISRNEK